MKGKPVTDAKTLEETFVRLVTRDGPAPTKDQLGKLLVFSGVGEFPARVKCATLSWHTLRALLDGKSDRVTTE